MVVARLSPRPGQTKSPAERRGSDVYGLAQKFAPVEEGGRAFWKDPADEARFKQFLALTMRCAALRASFESPKFAAVAVTNLDDDRERRREAGKRARENIKRMIANWIAADEAEKAERALDVTPKLEPVEVKPNPDDEGIDGELA